MVKLSATVLTTFYLVVLLHLKSNAFSAASSLECNPSWMRNILNHRYHKLNKELLWKVAENHVPEVLGIVLDLREKAAFYPDEDFLNIGSKRSD